MRFIADLHIHSRHARAVSSRMVLPELDRWADDKGILVMGTGDFTHPAWYEHLTKNLIPAEQGLYRLRAEHQLSTLKGTKANTRFMLTTEIACMYTRAGKGRRIHVLLFAPDLEAVKKINEALTAKKCNIKSDGRPIVGLDVVEVLKIALAADQRCVMVPAHVWTPWFGLLGSKSGFNSLEECFGEYAKHIFAVETGLSSDPLMNWRLSAFDHLALLSNSDSHSLERIGREANIFDTELSYDGIIGALKENTTKKFIATIEYYPEEGMYHVDGHRKCGVSYSPDETRNRRGICMKCGKSVTVGVLNRLDKLADRAEVDMAVQVRAVKIGEVMGKQYGRRPPFINLVTLDTIIAESLGVGDTSKKVKAQYEAMIKEFGSELEILMNLPLHQLSSTRSPLPPSLTEGIRRMRSGELTITPGFDGQYGEVSIFSASEKKAIKKRF